MFDKARSLVKYFALVSQIGLQLVITVLLGGVIGYKLDQRFSSSGIFTIIGVLLGVVGGFYGVYRLIMQVEKDEDEDKSS